MELVPQQRKLLSSSEPKLHNFPFNGNITFVLIAISVLVIILFVYGIIILLLRLLRRPASENPNDMESISVFHGQLRHLFELHDSGVDQFLLDTLPVFRYKAVLGSKDSFDFDCAVCLCGFVADDKLRLLPKCSHAFHLNCIDTWLLSHSSCPLCRASLVLESESGSSRENTFFRMDSDHRFDSSSPIPLIGSGGLDHGVERSDEIVINPREKLVHVKLGKCRSTSTNVVVEGTSDGAQAKRCFSVGSFAYILDENWRLKVPIRVSNNNQFCVKRERLDPATIESSYPGDEPRHENQRERSSF